MKDVRKTEIRVGVTVIFGVLLLVWILGWAQNYSLAPDRLMLIVKFPNVSGLEEGDQVTINGVRKGYVSEIVPKGKSVYLRLSLDSDSDLRSDARFEIIMLDLMGGKKVEVFPGVASEKINPKTVYNGNFIADIPTVMNYAGSLTSDLPVMVENVNKILNSVRVLLEDEQQKQDLKMALSNLQILTSDLKVFVSENKSKFESLLNSSQKITGEVNNILQTNRSNIDSTLMVSLNAVRKLDEILSRVDKFITQTERKENNAGKLLYDEAMLNELKETMKSVDKLVKVLNEQLTNDGVKVKADLDIF
ncbi:MAG: MCE family protein [Ignavibacteriaceae bacterium]|nr:MCE family protein [Ignavibacteriaceae bacterium]